MASSRRDWCTTPQEEETKAETTHRDHGSDSRTSPATAEGVLNNRMRRKGKRNKQHLTTWFWLRGGVCYTYVNPNSYRGAYRFLREWKRKWGNYERRHPSDETGLTVDTKRPLHVSLERLQAAGVEIVDSRPLLHDADLPEEVKTLALMPTADFIKAVDARLTDSFRNFRMP